ncbi:tetratricopeptide repeat protein [Streptosporangium sp. NPDC087985]|uniref:tetratricopeptide repeat protein n=1 Tax=Streptosporangium sp. NPDC087985 TaxID=3366196 RepID=UPI0038077DAF
MQVRRVVGVSRTGGRGSGYVIAPRLVLTSAHVTGPAGTSVQVFHPGQPGVYAAAVAWAGAAGSRDDAALVVIDDPAWKPPMDGVVRWGRTVTYQPGIQCHSWGLPALAQREGRPAELWQPWGTLNPGDRYVGDRYVMSVHGHPPEAPGNGSSPWEGMSGAALACGDLLAGVIAADPARLAHARLEAVPAYVLFANPAFRRVLATHTGQADQVLEPIEYQRLSEPAEPASGARPRSPTALLRARRQVVPFHGREQILTDLHAWADRPGFGACLVHADGGQGKTRLAQHLAGQLGTAGWAVVWLDARAPAADLEALKDAAAPLLIVVDYAEARTAQLAAVLEACARHRGATPVKVLLLARTAGSWWRELSEESALAETLLDGAVVVHLPLLEPDPGIRTDAYREALTAFASALAALPSWQDHPWEQLAATLPGLPQRAGLGNALTLHMTALVNLLDRATPTPAPTSGSDGEDGADGVEDRLLVHERRYWRTTATDHGLHPALSMATLTDALAAAIGWSAATRAQADALLERVPSLADQPADRRTGVRAWIAELYPSTVGLPWGDLQPDRLAECFLGRHLETNTDLADHLTPYTTPDQATRLLTIYTRAAAHPVFTHRLDEALTGLCMRHADVLATPAIQVATQVEAPHPLLTALNRLLSDPDLDAETLRQWSNHLPGTSYVLAEWATQLNVRLVDHGRHHSDLPNLATSLYNLSIWLRRSGRREEALQAITEAVAIRRHLTTTRPEEFLPDLAGSLNNLAVRLGELGRREEALQVITEAAQAYRRLAEARPDAFLPGLAGSLNNLSVQLRRSGRREEALQAITEAVAIYRHLTTTRPEEFLPGLADSLNNLAVRLGELGRREEALQAITEAVAIHRHLTTTRPEEFLPDLATSLYSLALRLGELGRREEALQAITEAVVIRRHLTTTRPEDFLPDLATSLNHLALLLGRSGRREEALQAITEAVAIHRHLTTTRPEEFLPGLATSLDNLALCLGELGRREEALEAITEAVAIRRHLAKLHPTMYQEELDRSLAFMNRMHNGFGGD